MIVGTPSAPLLALFCPLPGTVLELAFGSELAGAADQLPALALAMALLAVACLVVQHMIALGRVAFLPVLVPVGQTIAAVSLLALSLRGVPRPATA